MPDEELNLASAFRTRLARGARELVATVACAIYWFNPITWLAASRLRAEAEHAADDRRPRSRRPRGDIRASMTIYANRLRWLTTPVALADDDYDLDIGCAHKIRWEPRHSLVDLATLFRNWQQDPRAPRLRWPSARRANSG